MSEFQASAVGLASTAVSAVGGLLGGFFGSVGANTYEIERAVQARGTIGLSAKQSKKQNRNSANAPAVLTWFVSRPAGTKSACFAMPVRPM